MKALLLAAGLGKRLRPLTRDTPKCLLPIDGVQLLKIWLDSLRDAEIGPFIVNTHYLAEQVDNFIDGLQYRNEVMISHEKSLLGTAGTLLKHIPFFGDDDGLLIHADNYCLADLKEFISAHKNRPSNCLMTMMTFRTNNPSQCGIIELDKNNVVVGFHEKVKNPPGNLANGAIYILSNNLLKNLLIKDYVLRDFSLDVLPKLLGKIYTYETSDVLIDIGTEDSYYKANNLNK